jgi:hypothetical protein
MREVVVHKGELREKVQVNRDQHRGQYEKAIKGWRREAMQICQTAVQELEAGTRCKVIATESPPQDHTKDYDRVLAMIDMSAEETITLDEASFRQYVLDDWRWKEEWAVSNSKYLGE